MISLVVLLNVREIDAIISGLEDDDQESPRRSVPASPDNSQIFSRGAAAFLYRGTHPNRDVALAPYLVNRFSPTKMTNINCGLSVRNSGKRCKAGIENVRLELTIPRLAMKTDSWKSLFQSSNRGSKPRIGKSRLGIENGN